MRVCIVIPHFEHADLLPGVVAGLEKYELPIFVVDDGSSTGTVQRLRRLAAGQQGLEILSRASNGGKGAALKTGYRHALEQGFTHVVQVDADQQHNLDDVPKFLAAIRKAPEAFVLGVPHFDDSVPKSRLYGRQISVGMVWLLTLSRIIPDPLCGFRAFPLSAAKRVIDETDTGDRMDFDPEFAVRMVWQKTPVDRIVTRVSYDQANHVSHFNMVRDNVLLTRMYTRLTFGMLSRLPSLLMDRTAQPASTAEEPRS